MEKHQAENAVATPSEAGKADPSRKSLRELELEAALSEAQRRIAELEAGGDA